MVKRTASIPLATQEWKGHQQRQPEVLNLAREARGVLPLSSSVPLQLPWPRSGGATSPSLCSGHSAQVPVCPC